MSCIFAFIAVILFWTLSAMTGLVFESMGMKGDPVQIFTIGIAIIVFRRSFQELKKD